MIQAVSAPTIRQVRLRRLLPSSLEVQVRQCLHDNPYRQIQTVRCHCEGGDVLLVGTLPTYFLKQMAQESVRKVEGVDQIDNQIQVVYYQENAR